MSLPPLEIQTPLAKPRPALRFSVWLRRCHMYLGLFLTPWLAMYAVSTVVFNHWNLIDGGRAPRFQRERAVPYRKPFPPGATLRQKGEQILEDLRSNGSFGIQQKPDSIVIDRRDPLAPRRITFFPARGQLIIERQAYRTSQLLTMLHSQVSYANKLTRIKLWALSVDLTVVATFLLVITGFWMWWELKVTRRWGAVCIVLGLALFGLFLGFA